MRILIFIAGFCVLASCSDNNTTDEPLLDTDQSIKNKESIELRIKKYISAELGILATENYGQEIYRANLNNDDSIDYIVTINRFENAINEAAEAKDVAKRAEIGYSGRHNFFFFIDGSTKKMGQIIPVFGNPQEKLRVTFAHITSDKYKDIQIDHHIMNSIWRKFFSMDKTYPAEILKTEIALDLNTDEEKGFFINIVDSKVSPGKRVEIYEAIVGEYELIEQDDIYRVYPEMKNTGKLIRAWEYHAGANKFYIPK